MTRYAWINRLWQPLKNRPGKQHSQPRGKRFRPRLEALEARALLSGNTYLVNLLGDAGTSAGALSGDIRYCISQADKSANAGSTITFKNSVVGGKTITLTHGQLAITDNMTITGLGASSLTISGDKLSRVFDISSTTAKVTISGLTISGGSAVYGAGILNYGTLTVSNSILSGNTASYGGGIENSKGSLTITDSTMYGNSASTDGGGIYNTGSLTVNNSTLYGNAAKYGGGVYTPGNSSSALLLNNATIANNRASSAGSGIDVAAGSNVLLHNTLIAGNHAVGKPSDVSGSLNSSSNYNLIGDGSGGLSTANHNLLGSSAKPLNPLLAPLANYGGPTKTMALLPGSSAINDGSIAYGGKTDERGKGRVGATDIGAFESQGFSLAVTSGGIQATTLNTAFAAPLVVTVAANNSVEPVAGGVVTFKAPASGASAVLKGSPATIGSNGTASVTATANGASGTYPVTASAAGVKTPAIFGLINVNANLLVTTLLDTGNPSGTTSLRQAITEAETLSGPQTIGFASSILTQSHGNVIKVLSALPNLTGNITIAGPGANLLTVFAKVTGISVFTVNATATITISGLTLSGASTVNGGGVSNSGTLTVSDCTLIGNTASSDGGGIYNTGRLTITGSTLSGNSANNGGGIYSSGNTTVSNSTLSDNSVSNDGGGVCNTGSSSSLTISSSTLSGNSAGFVGESIFFGEGGGVFNGNGASLTVSDSTLKGGAAHDGGGVYNTGSSSSVTINASTLSGNTADNGYGGGCLNGIGASLTISSSTLSGNTAIAGGGCIENGGTLTISGSILTNNSCSEFGGGIDSGGTLTISNSNLSGNTGDQGGGAVICDGNSTINGSTISGNSGGGISNGGHMAVSNSTISGNSGGGIGNGGTMTVSNSTISGNSTGFNGGGINSDGTMTISNSTLSGNSADSGGGIFNFFGSLTVNDSTLSGNSATDSGGGIYASSHVTLSNATIAVNTAASAGGGLYVYSGSVVVLHNTLVATNLSGGKPSDVSGSLDGTTSNYNLIGDGSGGLSIANYNLLGTSAKPLNPLLAPLANYGGPTKTMALLPGSPAIDAGSAAYSNSTDQRGEPIPNVPDIGAFESQGFTITVTSGNNQSAAVNTAFAHPLVVTVKAKDAVEPVAGGVITFTVPSSGASAVLKGSPVNIGSNDQASVTATANGTSGTYEVTASAYGVTTTFSLTNTDPPATPASLPPYPAALTQSVFVPLAADNTLASAQSPEPALDLLWAELGLNWDLLLAGGNVHVLRNDPQAA
jgi:predicted outer membrane repeat protein